MSCSDGVHTNKALTLIRYLGSPPKNFAMAPKSAPIWLPQCLQNQCGALLDAQRYSTLSSAPCVKWTLDCLGCVPMTPFRSQWLHRHSVATYTSLPSACSSRSGGDTFIVHRIAPQWQCMSYVAHTPVSSGQGVFL